MAVVEGLTPFFSVLKHKDVEFWIMEEFTCWDRLGMRRMKQSNALKLLATKGNRSHDRLRSVHNYDILSNDYYQDRFMYTPGAYHGRSSYIISKFQDPWMKHYTADIVRLVCDLAYMPRTVGK